MVTITAEAGRDPVPGLSHDGVLCARRCVLCASSDFWASPEELVWL